MNRLKYLFNKASHSFYINCMNSWLEMNRFRNLTVGMGAPMSSLASLKHHAAVRGLSKGSESISGLKADKNPAESPGRFHHIACGASLSRRHQDTEKSSRPERRRPRRHQHLIAMTLRQLRQTQCVKMGGAFFALAGFKGAVRAIKHQ